MDPVTFLLVFSMVSAGWLTKVIQNGRTDRAYAQQGIVSPRYQTTLKRLEKAGIKPRTAAAGGRGAARAYFSNVWADAWLDLDERRRAKRAAREPYVYDPNRPNWASQLDAAVQEGVDRLRKARPLDAVKGVGRALIDPVGERRPLDDGAPDDGAPLPGEEPVEPSPDESPPDQSSTTDRATDPDPIEQEEPMSTVTDPTTTAAGAAATEVNTNEDARRNFTGLHAAAAKAADALVLLEQARQEMATHATLGSDGMATKRFDQAATAAAHQAADAMSLGTLAEWSERIETVQVAAADGLAALDKYRDAEDLVASENVDASTLEPTSA